MIRKYYKIPTAESLSFVLEKTFLDSLKFAEDNKPGSLDPNDIVIYGEDF